MEAFVDLMAKHIVFEWSCDGNQNEIKIERKLQVGLIQNRYFELEHEIRKLILTLLTQKNIKIDREIKTFEMCQNLFFFALNYLTIKI